MAVELLKRDLHQLMNAIPGLLAVLIVDKDGVPIIEVHQDIAPELSLRPSFLSVAVQTTEHIAKLGFGKCNNIYCDYENYQVLSFNKVASTVVVTLVADSKASAGMLFALNSEFDLVINELKKIKV